MDSYFHSSFNDIFVEGYLCSPTDKKNVEEAASVPNIIVQFGATEIHELVLRTDVESMYPTGELVFRTSNVDTMSKILLQQVSFLFLAVETSHMEVDERKIDRTDGGYYIVSKIWEDSELEDMYETKNGRDRFYHICFDSIRKLHFHGNCIYSSYKDNKEGVNAPDILKKIFKDVGIKLNIDYATDKSTLKFITSNNATVRSAFMYLTRRMFDGYKCDNVDIPFLSYSPFGDDYQLLSLDGLEKREKDKSEEMDGIIYGDTWMFNIVAGHSNAALNVDTDKTYFAIESGCSNKNDVIKHTFNRTRTDYNNDSDEFTEGKTVEFDHLVKKLLVMNPPNDDVEPKQSEIGSNFKMVPVKQFLDVVDKEFERNKDVFAPSFRSTPFRDNIYSLEYLRTLVFGSDRLFLDAPGSVVRTIGDMVTVRTDNDPNNAYNINKYQGKYILASIAHRFFRRDGNMLYRNDLELAMSSTTQSDIDVA